MASTETKMDDDLMQLTLQIRNRKEDDAKYAKFHGDNLISNKITPQVGLGGDLKEILGSKNWGALRKLVDGILLRRGLDGESAAQIAGSLSDYSKLRQKLIDQQVKEKYDKMLHPPLTYLGDAFQYRTADGKFNSVLHPHLGQAGAPYAKTVPSQTAPLGALPDPGDLFDKLMARQEGGRQSNSGLSSMLIYHATIIIHDIFRTNEKDKNISDSSSYLDLSPLYGYTTEMQLKVRDGKYKLGLLKPDTFAEDRLLRQPPGVCIMLVMYNRYHNYAAAQLRRINENGRFSVPKKYQGTKLEAAAGITLGPYEKPGPELVKLCKDYNVAWKAYQAAEPEENATPDVVQKFKASTVATDFDDAQSKLEKYIEDHYPKGSKKTLEEARKDIENAYDAAWKKLDDDLFNTARLITCGMYIQISIHDYLRALMGFHQFDTNFTLDPRSDFDQKKTTRGIGNQVTVEFNLLYRFHCAISLKDEKYTEDFMRQTMKLADPAKATWLEFVQGMKTAKESQPKDLQPWDVTFGLPHDPKKHFTRNKTTGLFEDSQMIEALTAAMDDPISNFGPRNVPKCLRTVELMGILQARKWEIGTLNDFREFFGMSRHATFESVTKNVDIQNALRDLYEHPDKIELYPGIFCESDQYMGLDPGPSESSSTLWSAIFSDAITLVRSDRFYTVDWNTNSLTSWGMKEVTSDNETCKSSVFHRLIQRAFPGWFPYNSVRFFHPFYTAQQNATYAAAQGYAPSFGLPTKPNVVNKDTDKPEFDIATSNPDKPRKPVYLHEYEKIYAVLNDKSYSFVHPAVRDPANFPPKMYEVLNDRRGFNPLKEETMENSEALVKYLNDLMRSIVKRESIAMNNATYQIDVTRDFAIPVVTRYVTDFLGFGHRVRTENDLSGSYSENEIYQHITNCQTFLSYSADETKLLARRKAFKTSMQFLSDLTLHANIAEANQWRIMQALFGRERKNPMTELGFRIAEKILEQERDAGKAAAVLVLVSLDFAYNSVLAFTSVLDVFLGELYEAADKYSATKHNADKHSADEHTAEEHTAGEHTAYLVDKPRWLTVQELALSDKSKDQQTLSEIVIKAARETVNLPIIRKALKARTFKTSNKEWRVEAGETVILDIREATLAAERDGNESELEFLTYQSTFAEKFAAYHPKHMSVLALTSMVKFVAQMKNPRRGHDAQGRLKKINFDWTAEGYSNFMAPMRIDRIAAQVENLPKNEANAIYTDKVLRPATDTYLTAEWAEMVPFPTTWKIRFDGFGKSNYSLDGVPFKKLYQPPFPDDSPPWYQPQGASHVGGSFADVVCICATPGTKCPCHPSDASPEATGAHPQVPKAAEKAPTVSSGCGLTL